MHYGKRKVVRKILQSPLVLVGVLVLFIILAKATWNIHEKASLSETKLSQMQLEFQKTGDHQRDLEKQVSYLSSEQGIESELRSKYRAVKNGESVAVIVDDEQTAAAANASNTNGAMSQNVGWFRRLLQGIGL
jgi:hypothetical protein